MVAELLESAVEAQGAWLAYVLFLVGAVVLARSVEKLVSYLTRAAFGLGVPMFALAVVLTGVEFDDAVVALAFGAGGLERVALGTALGTALAVTGLALAVAAVVEPFPVDVPREYPVLLAASPLCLLPFVLAGTIALAHGLALCAIFVASIGYVLVRERRRDAPVFRGAELAGRIEADGGVSIDDVDVEEVDLGTVLEPIPEDRFVAGRPHDGPVWLVLSLVALVGLVVGTGLLEASSEAIVATWGIERTVFGATVLTAALTLENLLLTVEPVRRGVPEIGIGHVVGSVLFSVTANVGLVAVVAEVAIPRDVLVFHLPAVVVLTVVVPAVVSSGAIRRRHGYALAGLDAAYWAVAFLVFGGLPVPDPLRGVRAGSLGVSTPGSEFASTPDRLARSWRRRPAVDPAVEGGAFGTAYWRRGRSRRAVVDPADGADVPSREFRQGGITPRGRSQRDFTRRTIAPVYCATTPVTYPNVSNRGRCERFDRDLPRT